VVEDDGDAEPLAQRARDPAEVRHRDGEDDDGVRPPPLDKLLEVPLPARRDPAGDRLARELVEAGLLRMRLLTAQVVVALEAREDAAYRLVRLALPVGRVRGDAPP